MSNNKNLARYLELYSEYVKARVGVHNYHVRFTEYVGRESYYRLGECIRKLPKIEQELLKTARAAIKEQKELDKAAKLADKLQRRKKRSLKNVDVSRGNSK